MLERDSKDHFRDPEENGIDEACRGNRRDNAKKQRKMMFRQFTADKIADSSSAECE